MSHPLVFNIKGRRGLGPGEVYVGRPSQWGNMFILIDPDDDEQRNWQVARYREWLLDHPEIIEAAKRELRGKSLYCHCAPKPCHADVLAEFANS